MPSISSYKEDELSKGLASLYLCRVPARVVILVLLVGNIYQIREGIFREEDGGSPPMCHIYVCVCVNLPLIPK